MSNFYLGSTALNQSWLGNDSIGSTFQTIPSLFSVFPVSAISNYWNNLNSSSVELQKCSFSTTFISKLYDEVGGVWISASNDYGIPSASGLAITTYDCSSNVTPVYVGNGVGGANSYVELSYEANRSFTAQTSGSQINLTGSFSWFFNTLLTNEFVSNLYSVNPFRFGKINFNVSRSASDSYTVFFTLNGDTGSSQNIPIHTGNDASLEGWYGLTLDYDTKELKFYHNSSIPTVITTATTWDFSQLDFVLAQEDSAGGWGMTSRLFDTVLLNRIPTQLEIENYNAWSRTTYSSLY